MSLVSLSLHRLRRLSFCITGISAIWLDYKCIDSYVRIMAQSYLSVTMQMHLSPPFFQGIKYKGYLHQQLFPHWRIRETFLRVSKCCGSCIIHAMFYPASQTLANVSHIRQQQSIAALVNVALQMGLRSVRLIPHILLCCVRDH